MEKNIFHAAKKGDLKALQECSREHVTQGLTFEGNTALHIAARGGHLEVVKWLLTLKLCFAGARNRDKNTPLHEAGKNGNSEVVRILLRYKKCCVYRRNQFAETALIIASEHGHIDAAKLLLEATPLFLVFWPRNDRQTCLNAAAYAGKSDVVQLILAVHGGHQEIVSEILKPELNDWHKSVMKKKDKFGGGRHERSGSSDYFHMMDEFEIDELLGLVPPPPPPPPRGDGDFDDVDAAHGGYDDAEEAAHADVVSSYVDLLWADDDQPTERMDHTTSLRNPQHVTSIPRDVGAPFMGASCSTELLCLHHMSTPLPILDLAMTTFLVHDSGPPRTSEGIVEHNRMEGADTDTTQEGGVTDTTQEGGDIDIA
ncbi:hypothetical protein SUGI_0550740 [Cryptomeria japonica]|nr:hypothetical protein SUGI_0550740 [Cryptomeria japonica]